MAEIGQTDFSFKPNVDMAGIASLFQKKAEAETAMKLQEEQRKASESNRALQVMNMASQLTQNLIQYSAQKQVKTSQQDLAALMAKGSQYTAEPGKVGTFYKDTPEYKATERELLMKVAPEKVAEIAAKEAFSEPEKMNLSKNGRLFINNDTGEARLIAPEEDGTFKVPAGYKESSIAKAEEWAKPRKEANTIRKEQFLEGQWNKLGKQVNSLDKGSRTSVGMAAVGNQRAARALEILDDPKMDTVLKKYVEADLAGIMQGGAPHEQMLRQQGYDNLVTKWAQLKQQITSEPQAIKVPEIRQQLRDTITGIMAVDNEILDTNAGFAKEQYLQAVQSDPKRFERMMGVAEKVKTIGNAKNTPGVKLDLKKASTDDLLRRLAGGQ